MVNEICLPTRWANDRPWESVEKAAALMKVPAKKWVAPMPVDGTACTAGLDQLLDRHVSESNQTAVLASDPKLAFASRLTESVVAFRSAKGDD
ncbi:hypothetical protein [Rubripirellula amarantea]|uniref:hypothetical protein n=1 Tax=Rubripirellula amarantea TaxID=2527999 RepID=UPI0011B80A7B|nr:hypothetical protein [Rubripirellula amarantea]